MENKYSRNDLCIEELLRFRKLEQAFLKRCNQFGYQEVRTATIEPLYIFTAQDVLSNTMLKRIYSFIDWDGWTGERVALRPDSSTCVVRFYNEHLRSKKIKQKLCYVENHFEYADTGDAISERWQCGVENIGESTKESDIEVIYMAYDILQEIGLKDFYLHLSYPYIIKKMINLINPDPDNQLESVIRDDIEAAKKILNTISGGKNLLNLLSIHGTSASYLENLKATLNDNRFKEIHYLFDNFISICQLLDNLECPYIIDSSFLGNLDYYTGISFQILSTRFRKNMQHVLCSGGRYDNLIGNMENRSESVPTTGFALYVRNILKHFYGDLKENCENICIYIGKVTKQNVKTGQILSSKLSGLGFNAQLTFIKPEHAEYKKYGLVIHVDKEKFDDEYKILYSQKIDKPLLSNLFGELNGQ